MKKHIFCLVTIICLLLSCKIGYANEIEFSEKVPINKTWKIEFAMEVEYNDVTNENIYVTDDIGKILMSEVYIGQDEHYVYVKPPQGNYKYNSNYTLHLSKNINSSNGLCLEEPVEFYFRTIEAPDVLEKNKTMNYVSSYFDKEKFDINITDKLELNGRVNKNYKWLWIQISDNDTGKKVIDDIFKINDGIYNKSYSINFPNGEYNLKMYTGKERYRSFDGYVNGIPLIKNSSEDFYIQLSKIYEDNVNMFNSYNDYHMENYITSSYLVQSDNDSIISLANEITSGLTDDYEKLKKIHDWVATNIAYDTEGYFSGNYLPTDALSVLNNKKAVCSGYANLTAALLRAEGIETRIVSGASLGYGSSGKGWDDIDKSRSTHAWNEVFINDRWVILDTTWDSGYVDDGQFFWKLEYPYFDPTLESFSNNHLILEYDEY